MRTLILVLALVCVPLSASVGSELTGTLKLPRYSIQMLCR